MLADSRFVLAPTPAGSVAGRMQAPGRDEPREDPGGAEVEGLRWEGRRPTAGPRLPGVQLSDLQNLHTCGDCIF